MQTRAWTPDSIEKRRPELFRDLRRTQADVNRMFGGLRFRLRSQFPAISIWTGPDGAILRAEVPGVSPDQVDLTLQQDTLTLVGRREPDAPEDATALRTERHHGPFRRRIVLPFRVEREKVSARLSRGLLTLELPRPPADRPHQIKVAHEQSGGKTDQEDGATSA